jgi:glucose/arabinose dehydrogenase
VANQRGGKDDPRANGPIFPAAVAHRLHSNMEEIRRETLLQDKRWRIRDIRQGPDGLLYVITDERNGALLRIEPAD